MLPFFDAIRCQILLFTTIYGNSFLSLRNRIELIFGGEGYTKAPHLFFKTLIPSLDIHDIIYNCNAFCCKPCEDIAMNEQKLLSQRIEYLCKEKRLSYYALSYRSTVPLTTLMHIVDHSSDARLINLVCINIISDFSLMLNSSFLRRRPHSKGSGARK